MVDRTSYEAHPSASRLTGATRRRRRARDSGLAAAILGASLLAACSDRPTPPPPDGAKAPAAPWQRTEHREPCAAFDLLRQPLFGDLHVHTRFSADAYIYGTRVGPHDAYAFARGEPIALADDDEAQTRSTRIDRPLDFAAVTDHAEFFGEVDLCSTEGSLVYDQELCGMLRQSEHPDDRFVVTVNWLYPAGIPDPPRSHTFCFDVPGVDCDAAAASVWREMQAAAEESYDRTEVCAFTTFVGYEHTGSPGGRHLHRNVIFRNDLVPAFAASQLETAGGGIPQGVWDAVEADCLNAGTGCDAVIIPHNPNLSGGRRWADPADAAEAQRRQDREPLVEIHQVKGNSECRFDRLAGAGVGTEDELCGFEQLLEAHQGPDEGPPPIDRYPRRNLVRNVLEDGLGLEDSLGVNPFKLGFVGSTDTHNATSGDTAEARWDGIEGNTDSSPARQISDGIRRNPGGLAVVWAEENSRDAIFDALRRRETYATSGTRPVVRFFAGGLSGVECGAADFVRRAYETGTPMGGDLGAVRGAASPRFAVLAVKDPGTAEAPGTDLERVQVVKGWVAADGTPREKVFDVAGGADVGPWVDPATCEPVGRGANELCAVWEDPEFDRWQRAFYYLRVLERPTCRWSTLVCKAQGIDPFSATCAAQAAAAGEAFADCCLDEANDPFLEPLVRERAWSSPVWYRPDGISRVEGGIVRGTRPDDDALELSISLGVLPASLNLDSVDVTVRLSDDDEIHAVTVPAGAWRAREPAATARERPAKSFPQVYEWTATGSGRTESLQLEIEADGSGVFRLEASGLDLSAAQPVDHMVRVALESGTYRSSVTRLWVASRDGGLGPADD